MTKTPVRLTDLFRYFRSLPHQLAAIQELEELIPASILHKDNNWYRTWTNSGKQPAPAWLEPASELIREFEGLRLVAYRCPAGEWTIGYGTTRYPGKNGGPVRKGDTLTAPEAEVYMEQALLDLYVPGLMFMLPAMKGWSANRVAALASFAYNVGLGAVERSTLIRRLSEGEDPDTVITEELPRWNKANNTVLPGLVRRRKAEVNLFLSP